MCISIQESLSFLLRAAFTEVGVRAEADEKLAEVSRQFAAEELEKIRAKNPSDRTASQLFLSVVDLLESENLWENLWGRDEHLPGVGGVDAGQQPQQ